MPLAQENVSGPPEEADSARDSRPGSGSQAPEEGPHDRQGRPVVFWREYNHAKYSSPGESDHEP